MKSRGMLFPVESMMTEWTTVTVDELYITLALLMLMGNVQKLTFGQTFPKMPP
jgi:hypothetical protein